MLTISAFVGQNQDRRSSLDGLICRLEQLVQRPLGTCFALSGVEQDRQRDGLEPGQVDLAQLLHFRVLEHGDGEPKLPATFRLWLDQTPL